MSENVEKNVTDGISGQGKGKMTQKQKYRLIIFAVLAVILISFVSQNYGRIRVEFLFWTFQIRLIVVILTSFLFGGIMTYLLMKYRQAKRKKKFK
jgi:uncharacterized integral membrane protein